MRRRRPPESARRIDPFLVRKPDLVWPVVRSQELIAANTAKVTAAIAKHA